MSTGQSLSTYIAPKSHRTHRMLLRWFLPKIHSQGKLFESWRTNYLLLFLHQSSIYRISEPTWSKVFFKSENFDWSDNKTTGKPCSMKSIDCPNQLHVGIRAGRLIVLRVMFPYTRIKIFPQHAYMAQAKRSLHIWLHFMPNLNLTKLLNIAHLFWTFQFICSHR